MRRSAANADAVGNRQSAMAAAAFSQPFDMSDDGGGGDFEADYDAEQEMEGEALEMLGGAEETGGPMDDDDEELFGGAVAPPARSSRSSRKQRRVVDSSDDDDDGDDVGGNRTARGVWQAANHPTLSSAEAARIFGAVQEETHQDALAHARQNEADFLRDSGGSDGGGGSSVAGPNDGGGNRNEQASFPGFVEAIMKNPEPAQPYLLPPSSEGWVSIPSLGPDELICKRAMCVNVPSVFWKRDADFYSQWQLLNECEVRCKAAAAIASAVFAGMAMGIPSGAHEELQRSADDKKKAFNYANKYTYIPRDDVRDSWPMFQVGIEELYNSDQTEVVALRTWLFIYDETHSTSHILRRLIENNDEMLRSQRAGAEMSRQRGKDASSEATRHDKAGVGFGDLDSEFEKNVGMQYKRIVSIETFQHMLEIHSGRTSTSKGRPCVADMSAHVHCAAGRRAFEGSSDDGVGGRHPLAVEFVLNAQRPEALAFGLVGCDGADLDIFEPQLDVSSYFEPGSKFFSIPKTFKRPSFWLCSSTEKKSPFDMRLARSLQGSVLPGEHIMKLFLEHVQREKNCDRGVPDAPIDYTKLVIDQNSYTQLRSLATQRDEYQRSQDALMRNTIRTHDYMSPVANAAAAAGGESTLGSVDGEDMYTIKTVPMTEKVRRENDRIWTTVVAPWQSRRERHLQDLKIQLLDMTDDGEIIPENQEELPRTETGEIDDARIDADSYPWGDYRKQLRAFHLRLYLIKKDLTQYHLRLLRTCFLSTRDSSTLPAGYKSMFRSLEQGVKANGGSGSIAFGSCSGGRPGRQMMMNDRMVYGALQEWLGQIFVKDCKVDGRDRRIMDEMYLHAFEVYAETTFVLIIASEKGQGKSVRAVRLSKILPEGWCSRNSANTARSGMNGNNSPSNGTVVICDEMISDLTPAEANERMEYYKTIVGMREYEIERTRSVKHTDGTDSHVTVKIVTDHKEIYLICCNMGQCFTAGLEEPTSGKEAMIQRTICIQARAEADRDSPEAEFEENLKRPAVAARIADFRLFTSHVGYVRLAMSKVSWLQPDFAIANLIFKEGDRMLVEEYGLSHPEPRRLVKRTENLRTMCVMEAVARVFLFKQPAMAYEAGRPNPETGGGRRFDVADYWDVLRTLRPTREMILAAWSHSLEYSIGTSTHGVNVMTAVCQSLGFHIDWLFKQIPKEAPDVILPPDEQTDAFELEQFMKEAQRVVAHDPLNGEPVTESCGATMESLQQLETTYRNTRKARNEFRRNAIGHEITNKQPLDAIRAVAPRGDASRKFSTALFPTITGANLYYKSKELLTWATGRMAKTWTVTSQAISKNAAPGTRLAYKEFASNGGAKSFDYGWIVVQAPSFGGQATWRQTSDTLRSNSETCQQFDMHKAGVVDALFMLASSENKRVCPEMPRMPFACTAAQAFVNENGDMPGASDMHIGLRPFAATKDLSIRAIDDLPVGRAGGVAVVEARSANSRLHRSKIRWHHQLDTMIDRGRLPCITPHVSTKMKKGPPLRKVEGSGVEINSVAAFEHTHMVLESILRCSHVPGLANRQERFANTSTAPDCLTAPVPTLPNKDTDPERRAAIEAEEAKTICKKLPYSIDIVQIAWTLDLAARFYDDTFEEKVRDNNAVLTFEGLGPEIKIESMPELTLKYSGFPKDATQSRTESLRLLSVPVARAKPADQNVVDIAKADPLQELDPELLRYETELSIGRHATDRDIEDHRRNLIGAGFTFGVEGDVFNHQTFETHLHNSMLGRGNVYETQDADDEYVDTAFAAILDAEYLFFERRVERECAAKADAIYNRVQIDAPTGSTYRWEQSTEAEMAAARIARAASGGKRRIGDANIHSLPANSRSGSKVKKLERLKRQVRAADEQSGTSGIEDLSPSLRSDVRLVR